MCDFKNWILNKYSDDAERNIYLVPKPIRPILCILIAHYPIGNGGYKFFFENTLNGNITYEMILDSYKIVGLTDIANSFETMLNIFPNGTPQLDLKERRKFLDKYFTEKDFDGALIKTYYPIVEEAENIYFEKFDDIPGILEKYYETLNSLEE